MPCQDLSNLRGCGRRSAEQVADSGELNGQALAVAGTGYRGPRVPSGQGHEAEFISYRDKTFDT